ncbi:histidine phosphatase family protein [Micromonospora sp. NPDC047134]|uniref:histidine phosphatase family protein n=1 Tax=Micromonospora sp. NPDC047134 TaxID=3154340 RepID=UPI0033D27576
MGQITLIRHGATAWSTAGRHTSYTDLELTPDGERQARSLGPALVEEGFVAVLASPRLRAVHTARLAGLGITDTDEDLAEWNYGDHEGRTTADIHQEQPGWSVWTDGCPGGESPNEVGERIDRLLARVHPLLDQGRVALIGHAHSLRVLAARWIGLPPSAGGLLRLDTGTLSLLGHEHARRVVLRWNHPPTPPARLSPTTARH